MILEIGDWIFDVDMTATMEYSATEALEHCLCCYCRNFYGSVDERYPGLRPFLAGFGVDVEAPDELMPFFPPSECVAFYAVSGRILQEGQGPLLVDDLAIYPQSSQEAMINTYLKGQYFFLKTDMMHLKWILDEPMEDALSPANEPSFMKRVVDYLLGRAPKDRIDN